MPSAAPLPLSTAIAKAIAWTIAMTCIGVRRGDYGGGYCAAKTPLVMQTLTLMVPKDPPMQSMGDFSDE